MGQRHRFLGHRRPNLHEPVRENAACMEKNHGMVTATRRIRQTHRFRAFSLPRMAQQNRHRPAIHRALSRHRFRRNGRTQINPESRQLGTQKHRQTKPATKPSSHPTRHRNPKNQHQTHTMDSNTTSHENSQANPYKTDYKNNTPKNKKQPKPPTGSVSL